MPDPLGTPAEVAKFLRKTEKTLANWRSLGIGPRYIKSGAEPQAAVLYDWADVRAWIAERTVTTRQPA